MQKLGEKDWVVVAAYNEKNHISSVLSQISKYTSNIVVVDDGSRDDTFEIANKHTNHCLRHMLNMGKGAALKTGCDYAIQCGAENLFVLDADGQHNPDLLPQFKESLSFSDILFSYRSLSDSMPFVLRFGNWFISKATYLLYGMKLYDTQCGYRAFTAEAYVKVRWDSSDYGMESEMIKNAGKNKLTYAQIPIETIYTDSYKGTTVIDGMKIVIRMFLWRLSR
jgi:UDP-N-acetylglucosamine---dolichyl-phosphate N-acetylglucosaminyltransferase